MMKRNMSVYITALMFLWLTLTGLNDCAKHRRKHRLEKAVKAKIRSAVPLATEIKSTEHDKHRSKYKEITKDETSSQHQTSKSMVSRTYVANPFDQLGDLLGINGAFIPTKFRRSRYGKGMLEKQKASLNRHQLESNELPVKKSGRDSGPGRGVVIPEPPVEQPILSDFMTDRFIKRPFIQPRVPLMPLSNGYPFRPEAMYNYHGSLRPEVGAYEKPQQTEIPAQQMVMDSLYARQRPLSPEQTTEQPYENAGKTKQYVPNMEYTEAVPVPNVNPIGSRYMENPKHASSRISKGKYGNGDSAEANLAASEIAQLTQSVNLLQAESGGKKGIYSHDLIKNLQLDPTWDFVEANLANQAGNHPRINSPSTGNAHQNKIESAMEPPEGTPIGKPYVPHGDQLGASIHLQGQQVTMQHRPGLASPLGSQSLTGVAVAVQSMKTPLNGPMSMAFSSAQNPTKINFDDSSMESPESNADYPESSNRPSAKYPPPKGEDKINDSEEATKPLPEDPGKEEPSPPQPAKNRKTKAKKEKKIKKVNKTNKASKVKIKHLAKSAEDRILDQLASAGLENIVKEFTTKLKKIEIKERAKMREENSVAVASGEVEETNVKPEAKIKGEDNENKGHGSLPETEKTANEKAPLDEADHGRKEEGKSISLLKAKLKPKDLTTNFVKFLEDMAGKLKVDKLKVAEQLVKDVEKAGKTGKDIKEEKEVSKDVEQKETEKLKEDKESGRLREEKETDKFKGEREGEREKFRENKENENLTENKETEKAREEKEIEKLKEEKEQKEPSKDVMNKQNEQAEASDISQENFKDKNEKTEGQSLEHPKSAEENQGESEGKEKFKDEEKGVKVVKEGKAGKQEIVTFDDNNNVLENPNSVAGLLNIGRHSKLALSVASLLPFKKFPSKFFQEAAMVHSPFRPVLKNAFTKHHDLPQKKSLTSSHK